MKVLPFTGLSLFVIGMVLGACQTQPVPVNSDSLYARKFAKGQGKSDTFKYPDPAGLIELKVSNMHIMMVAPPGLIVMVPKGCKIVVEEHYKKDLALAQKTGDRLPEEIETPSGARLQWFYGILDEKSRSGYAEYREKLLREPMGPDFERIVSGQWIGAGGVSPSDPEIDKTLGRKPNSKTKGYMLLSEDAQLILSATWDGDNAQAKAEAQAALEAFIASVEPDMTAKPANPFPSAGHEENAPVPTGTEVAMKEGMVIEATTPVGVMTITAGPGLKRTYTWEGASRFVIMGVRKERWYGSLGLMYPGPGNHWEEHNGITRGVLEEGQQHFKSEAEFQKWLKEREWIPYVYTNDGLLVGWGKVLERNQLNVEVWQIMINGKKPKNLPGAKDANVKISSTKVN